MFYCNVVFCHPLHSVELGELVLHRPSVAWPLFQEVCECICVY